MGKIVKENGYVYEVIEHDVYGKNITKVFLGKDPDTVVEKPIEKKPIEKKKKDED